MKTYEEEIYDDAVELVDLNTAYERAREAKDTAIKLCDSAFEKLKKQEKKLMARTGNNIPTRHIIIANKIVIATQTNVAVVEAITK